MYKQESNTFIVKLLCIACALTVLSQIPYFVNSEITQMVSTPIWVIVLFVGLVNNSKIYIGRINGFVLLLLLLVGYLVITMLVNGSFLSSSIDKQIFMSSFILLIGVVVGHQILWEDIEKICTVYILSALVTCSFVFFEYVRGADLSSRVYAYASKNSISQILLFAWILIVIFKFQQHMPAYKKGFYFLGLVILTWTMIGVKSRASILGIPLFITWVLINGKLNRRLKNILIFACLIVFLFLLLNQNVLYSFMNNIIYGGRDTSNLNDLSSGRSSEWLNFFNDFSQNGLLGDSTDKRECVFLSAFLQHGIIGGIIISLLVFYPLSFFFRNIEKNNNYYIMLTSLAIVAILNGFFEQQAPFGPGAKCFFLWLMVGLFGSMELETQDLNIMENRIDE